MKKNVTIAGLDFTLNFCKKIGEENIKPSKKNPVPQPMVNVSASKKGKVFTVNILGFVPNTPLESLEGKNLISGLQLNEENTLFLNYDGVSAIETDINGPENGVVICRDFNFEYDCPENEYEDYILYHTQFTYSLVPKNFQSVDAIMVSDVNLDPRGSRGTVTTVQYPY